MRCSREQQGAGRDGVATRRRVPPGAWRGTCDPDMGRAVRACRNRPRPAPPESIRPWRAGCSRRPTPRPRHPMRAAAPPPRSTARYRRWPVSLRSAAAGSISAISSTRRATLAAAMIVCARTLSTPARCHSQDGIDAQTRGEGNTRKPVGAHRPGPGPGAGSPYLCISSRQARKASAPTTFCSSTAGTSASRTREVLPTRSPGCLAARSRSTPCPGAKPTGSSHATEQFGKVGEQPRRAWPPGGGRCHHACSQRA